MTFDQPRSSIHDVDDLGEGHPFLSNLLRFHCSNASQETRIFENEAESVTSISTKSKLQYSLL
jgi:hypothetical protein